MLGYSQAAFTYVASEWPSIAGAPPGDLTGYSAAPPGWSKFPYVNSVLNTMFPIKVNPKAGIARHSEASTQGACANLPVPLSQYSDNGECWWTCGLSVSGANCLRPATDKTQCAVNGPNWTLSFDDGPMPSTMDLLKFLVDHNLKATFFMVGSHMVQHPEIVKAVYDAGMSLGIHSWSHHTMTAQTDDVIRAEVLWTAKAFYDIIGVVPNLFRPRKILFVTYDNR